MAANQEGQFQQSDAVTKLQPDHKSDASDKIRQEAYDMGQPTQTARAGVIPSAKPETAAAKVCKPSPLFLNSYRRFVDKAIDEAYAPEKFGDPQKVRHEFDCDIHSEADARKYAAIVLKRSGDSHTEILSPAQNKSLQEKANPTFVGFGIKTTFDPVVSDPQHMQGIAVVRPYPGSPGEQAGLKVGDEILSVDNTDLTKLSYEEANAKLHGIAGSVARLVVERDGEQVDVDVERRAFAVPAVTDVTLPDKMAYISIDNFTNEHLNEQLKTSLLKHEDARGFIIDLRKNGGGNVDFETLALSQVMKDGDIMKMRSRNTDDKSHVSYVTSEYKLTPEGVQVTETSESPSVSTVKVGSSSEKITFTSLATPKVTLQARMKNLVGNRPVEILTDDGTASAAEMFTGAEHDTGNARTVGTNTYGKGIGGLWSSKLPADAGEIISNMRWWTPSGNWAGDAEQQKHGLKADIEVSNDFGAIPLTARDKQLQAAIDDLKRRIADKK